MSCGVGHRHDSDPELLWLRHRPAALTLIQALALELPYAVGAALKRQKKKKEKEKEKRNKCILCKLEKVAESNELYFI